MEVKFEGEHTHALAEKILNELKKSPKSAWDLSKITNELYQSVDYVLKKLLDKGIVTREKVRGEKTYKYIYYINEEVV